MSDWRRVVAAISEGRCPECSKRLDPFPLPPREEFPISGRCDEHGLWTVTCGGEGYRRSSFAWLREEGIEAHFAPVEFDFDEDDS